MTAVNTPRPAVETIRWEPGDNGIITLVLDDPSHRANTMTDEFFASLNSVIDRLTSTSGVRGAIFMSAKTTFFAGGDLEEFAALQPEDMPTFQETVKERQSTLRRLETAGIPIAAIIDGAALGGGLELALACHRRFAVTKNAVVGLPEVTLGLLPGGGGIVRTVRLLGARSALEGLLLRGQTLSAKEALDLGVVHEVGDTTEELINAAKAWILDDPSSTQPWDSSTGSGDDILSTPSREDLLETLSGSSRRLIENPTLPAPRSIFDVSATAASQDLDQAFDLERSSFVELAGGQVSKNLIGSVFFDTKTIRTGASRPGDIERSTARQVGIVGAGIMGSGIAYACAAVGIDVLLHDISQEQAEKGKAYAAKAAGRQTTFSDQDRESLLGRITATSSIQDFANCEVVIEAAFEDPAVKRGIFASLGGIVAPGTLIASNTSTLPISELAEGFPFAAEFVGLHFFSPVDRMDLVEVIRGDKTSDSSLARAYDLARQLKKLPIVVKDSRGFFTSRVIRTYLFEGAGMIEEGLSAYEIERAALAAGFPLGTLALFDETTLSLNAKVSAEYRNAAERERRTYEPPPGENIIQRMIEEFDRPARSAGRGFYDYVDGRRAALWSGLDSHFRRTGAEIDFEDMKDRFLFIQAIETMRTIAEGVISSEAEANIGSIHGIAFPRWTGGVARFVRQYPGGVQGFRNRAAELASRYGARFEPPSS